jgi:hypothetical protein
LSPSEKLTGGFDNGLGAVLIDELGLASFLSKKSSEGISGFFQQYSTVSKQLEYQHLRSLPVVSLGGNGR